MYTTYIFHSLQKNTEILEHFPMLATPTSEATTPLLLILLLKKSVGKTFNRNIGSTSSYSLVACYATWVKRVCLCVWTGADLLWATTTDHFPKVEDCTEEQTSAKQCRSRKGNRLGSGCHQISSFGQNSKQPPLPKFLRPLPSFPVVMPKPASQVPCPQL